MLDATKNPGGLCDIYTEEALAAAAAGGTASADPAEGFVRTLEGINRLRKAHKPATNKASLKIRISNVILIPDQLMVRSFMELCVVF